MVEASECINDVGTLNRDREALGLPLAKGESSGVVSERGRAWRGCLWDTEADVEGNVEG